MEAKSEPYRTSELRGKLELSKDVAGFANAQGGIILIGIRTERSPEHLGDEITEVRPFAETLVDRDQYHSILCSWIHPEPEGIEIRWFPCAGEPNRGVVAITVPAQREALRPFLLARTLGDSDRQIESLFGYTERKRAGITPLSVRDLYAHFRDGRRFDTLQQRIDPITEELQRLHRQYENLEQILSQRGRVLPQVTPPTQPAISIKALITRKDQAVTEADLGSQPYFFLGAVPTPIVEFPTLFQETSPLVKTINDPPILRPHAFGVASGGATRIIKGQLRRGVVRGSSVLEVWRDGTILYVVEASDFLCWGTRAPGGPLRLNPLALCESTYAFADLTRIVFGNARSSPLAIDYIIALRNLTVQGQPAQLIPGPLGTMRSRFEIDVHHAPGPDMDWMVKWEKSEVQPGAVAYLIVREVYRWFSLNDEEIPYTSVGEDGETIVDPEVIREAHP
jgi:hypothetical protein